MISLYEEGCPYKADDCPKIKDLRKLLQDNKNELDETKRLVLQLNTTLKLVGKILSGLMTIIIAILGGSLI